MLTILGIIGAIAAIILVVRFAIEHIFAILKFIVFCILCVFGIVWILNATPEDGGKPLVEKHEDFKKASDYLVNDVWEDAENVINKTEVGESALNKLGEKWENLSADMREWNYGTADITYEEMQKTEGQITKYTKLVEQKCSEYHEATK